MVTLCQDELFTFLSTLVNIYHPKKDSAQYSTGKRCLISSYLNVVKIPTGRIKMQKACCHYHQKQL